MARIARVVAPGVPHHVTQRGNRKQRTFFCESDFRAYLKLIADWCSRHRVDIWAYCLMPNHVHLIAVPESKESLRCAIGEAHRRYTLMVNTRQGWQGCLWQGRFFSFPMDDSYLFRAIRYIELNPVRAGMVENPEDYPWSSARTHILRTADPVVTNHSLSAAIADWHAFLAEGIDDDGLRQMRLHQKTGRPMGSETFIDSVERESGRTLRPLKRGPKRKAGVGI